MSLYFIYLKKALKALLTQPTQVNIASLFKYFRTWKRYLASERNPINDRMPWMAFSAIDFLKSVAGRDMNVFEYGSGGSTLFWSSKVRKVISVEHDRIWYDKVKSELEKKGIKNVDYVLKEAENDPGYAEKNFHIPSDYISGDGAYFGKKFESYVCTINNYPDSLFDIVVVDGRARPSCIMHSLKKIKRGGYLVVDNSDRSYYLSGFDFQKWQSYHFFGPVPYSFDFSKTSIFRKIENESSADNFICL